MSEIKEAKKQVLIASMAIIAMSLLVMGISYSMFSYAKLGEVEEGLSKGGITFLFNDSTSENTISLSDAFPVKDSVGVNLSDVDSYFDFKVLATSNDGQINYEITLKMDPSSTLSGNLVKVYLEDLDTLTGTPLTIDAKGVVKRFNQLNQTTIINLDDKGNKYDERTIHIGASAANVVSYERNYRLRLWLAGDTDFTPLKNEDGSFKLDDKGNFTYQTSGKTFKAFINVYAKAQ